MLEIGDNCGLSNTAFTCANHIKIGDNVFIGSGCRIYDTDFHPIDYNERINFAPTVKTAPIIIGAGAFIGEDSAILKGVHIGQHSRGGFRSYKKHSR